MTGQDATLEQLIKELPPDVQREVEDFVRFLLEKRVRKPRCGST